VLAVARAGTLTGASRELNVVRTTVGRRLRALEERMGVRLFNETPEGLTPTAAGDELAQSAEAVENEVLAVESRLAGQDAELRGTLRVSTIDFIYECFADAFASFVAAYPGVELSVLSTDEEVSLRRREADVAIRLQDAPPETLVGRRLGKVEFGIYAARSLVERIGRGVAPDRYPWLRFDARDDGRGLESWYERFAAGAPVAMGFDSYTVMRHAVRSGVGTHFLARFDAERFDELVRIGPEEDSPTRTLWALTLPELRTNSRVRTFLAHLDDAVRPLVRP
jgi:DNA-binding transcriptional LysR family regulator